MATEAVVYRLAPARSRRRPPYSSASGQLLINQLQIALDLGGAGRNSKTHFEYIKYRGLWEGSKRALLRVTA
jgi:hypothetical protein